MSHWADKASVVERMRFWRNSEIKPEIKEKRQRRVLMGQRGRALAQFHTSEGLLPHPHTLWRCSQVPGDLGSCQSYWFWVYSRPFLCRQVPSSRDPGALTIFLEDFKIRFKNVCTPLHIFRSKHSKFFHSLSSYIECTFWCMQILTFKDKTVRVFWKNVSKWNAIGIGYPPSSFKKYMKFSLNSWKFFLFFSPWIYISFYFSYRVLS